MWFSLFSRVFLWIDIKREGYYQETDLIFSLFIYFFLHAIDNLDIATLVIFHYFVYIYN